MLRYLYIGLLLLTLFGCSTVGPEFITPKVDLPTKWDTKQNSTTELLETNEKWWARFNDPILDDFIVLAHAQNLNVRQAILRIFEARAILGDTNVNRYPTTSLSSNATTTSQSEHSSPQPLTNDEMYSLGFDSRWEIDFWGRQLRERESSDASHLAMLMDYGNILVSTTAEVASTYVNIRIMEQRIALIKESIDIQQRALEIAEVWFKNGGRTELDLQQTKGLVFETRSQLPELEQQLYKLETALALLVGTHREAIIDKLRVAAPIPSFDGEVSSGIPNELLRRRPDVRNAEYLAKVQNAQVGISEAAFYPSFSLTGSLSLAVTTGVSTLAGGINGSSSGDLFSSEAAQYSVGPGLSWNIFNFGRINNRVRASDSRLQQSIESYKQVVLSAVKETNDGLISVKKTREKEKLLRQSTLAYDRASALSLEQYKDGAADYQSVLDSLRQLVTLRQTHVQSKGQITLNIIGVYKALGGGWSEKALIKLDNATIKQMQERTNWGSYFDE